ncbi:MAG: hypothetical protein Q7W55_04510 [Pseudohongiella sp.]|nr:hypothetical protein [Pseudohongiella sp.]
MKPFHVLLAGSLLSFSTSAVTADPVFDGHALHISAVDVEEQPGLYQQIELRPAGDDLWRLHSIREGVTLRNIENVSLVVTDSTPVQVFLKVEGKYMNGCEELGHVSKRYDAGTQTLHVFMYYRHVPEGIACTADVRDFELIEPLPVYGAEAGEYTVTLNDEYELPLGFAERNVLK